MPSQAHENYIDLAVIKDGFCRHSFAWFARAHYVNLCIGGCVFEPATLFGELRNVGPVRAQTIRVNIDRKVKATVDAISSGLSDLDEEGIDFPCDFWPLESLRDISEMFSRIVRLSLMLGA
jgi:hypothetical protein